MGELAAGVDSAAATALDRFFETFYRQRPVTATFTGLHAYDDRLPDWSRDGLARAADELRQLRQEVEAAGRVPDDGVRTFPRDVDLALADATLDIALAEHESGHFVHRNPSLWTGEAIFGVLSLVTRDFAPLAQRLDWARARLEAIPAFMAQARALIVEAPLDWKSRAKRECQAATALFGDALPAMAAERAANAVRAWGAAAEAAARAFADFDTWLGHVGIPRPLDRFRSALATAPAARESIGPEVLGTLLARGHFVTTPVGDLRAEALAALDEASARLDEMARPHGGWPAVQDRLAAAHPSSEEYFRRFHETWQRCRDAAAAYDLVTWPEAPLRYVPYPAHVRDAAPQLYYLHYRSPAPFDPFGTFDYVVPGLDGVPPDQAEARLRQWNDSVITLNHVIHHGAIGHHVQNHHAYRCGSRIGRVAAVDAACRIAMFVGGSLAEGWACYVCDLMDEIEFLSPLERIAQQHTRVRIAARAVADLSIHTGQMTVPQAAWLYEDRASMSQAAARAEAVRNGMYPGTAVMYWLGTRELHRLRAEKSRRDGAAFSLRRFHDRVLSYGSIPVALISRLMLAEEAAA
jgi:uncharacterized protein (DUF885 family)